MLRRCLLLCCLMLLLSTTVLAQDELPPDCRRTPPPAAQSDESQTVLGYTMEQARQRYDYALEQGAQFVPTPDGRSYYLLWLPQSDSDNPPPMIVTLHGHASSAVDEFFLWHEYAAERGYGILALQWWRGEDPDHDLNEDYYLPREIYPIFSRALCDLGTLPGTALLHGFSRGSAVIYAVTAFDRHTGNNFFGLTIANAGGAEADYPPNQQIEAGDFGEMPYANSHWVLFCGGQDPAPELSGCPAMHRSQTWLENLGGTVDLFIEDADADHGGFHRNPENVEAALAVFDEMLASRED
ncbi:MAG: hypothetical protein U0694_06595 [Anaerolineae bacterium]